MYNVCENLTPERPWNCSELVKAQIVSPSCQIYCVQLRNESVGHHRLHFCRHHCRPHYYYHNQPQKHRGRFRWTRNEFSKANIPSPGRPSAKPHRGEGDVKKCPTNTRGDAQAWSWKALLLCELLLEPCVRTSSSLD